MLTYIFIYLFIFLLKQDSATLSRLIPNNLLLFENFTLTKS